VDAWVGHKPPPAGKVGLMYMLEGGTYMLEGGT